MGGYCVWIYTQIRNKVGNHLQNKRILLQKCHTFFMFFTEGGLTDVKKFGIITTLKCYTR